MKSRTILDRMGLSRCVLSAVVMAAALAAVPVHAQADSQPAIDDELRDFIFFVNINRDDAALLKAEELMARGITPLELLDVVERERMTDELEQALGRALRRTALEPTAARLFRTLETARLQRARDPDEIAKNIDGLTGTLRAKLFARDRLKAAGEYALPQLLDALLQRRDLTLRTEVERLLTESGRSPVVPLTTAILEVDPASQELIASILGRLGYKAAAPALAEVRTRTENDAVRNAAIQALQRLEAPAGEPAALYLALAEGYYNEREDLTAFPGEDVQLLWSYDPAIGLIPTAIDSSVFHEAMAMQHAGRAMELGARRDSAVGLWVAANFSREIDEPAGYDNPAYPPSMREALYYATLSGPGVGESVLDRALGDRDTPLAQRAVDAIQRTAGPNQIWDRGGRAGPLSDALGYPSRRVQYDAALAIAASLPASPFAGSERVIPTLTSALRFSGQKYAVVLAQDTETYGSYRRVLETAGYTVLPFGRNVAEVYEPMIATPGIDFVMIQAGDDATLGLIGQVRAEPRLAAAPLLALAPTDELPRLRRTYGGDVAVAVRSIGIGEQGIGETLSALIRDAAAGEISEAEAIEYAERSVRTLRELAIAGSGTVLNVTEASVSLIEALAEAQGPIRLEIADVLGMIGRPDAQGSLAQAAFEAVGTDRVALLDTLAASARRHGNLLDPPAIERLLELAASGSDEEATAAASVIGALGIPQRDLVRLILANG
ncbi:MAG: hypothetical protein AAGB48_09600 [Planctomycetota bacterium]